MRTDLIAETARILDEAQRAGRAVPQNGTDVGIATAYAIQAAAFARRLDRGERDAGVKLGFTSRAKREQMGIADIIVGRLTEEMRVEDGGEIDLGALIHPRIEPEIAYRLGSDCAIDAVAPALEIIDSRYLDFRFSLPDVIADNASSAHYVIGPWSPPGTEVADLAVRLEIDGQVVESGSTADILGHPVNALRRLEQMAATAGIELRAGQIVLAGAATSAAPFPAARAAAHIDGLGSVSVRGRG